MFIAVRREISDIASVCDILEEEEGREIYFPGIFIFLSLNDLSIMLE